MSKQDTDRGLEVVSLRGEGKNWYVQHAASEIPVFSGFLRQKRFAVAARADFLALGIDYTLSLEDLRGKLAPSAGVYALWRYRARLDEIDPSTGEHYSASTHYGQEIPSARQAAGYRAALARRAAVLPVQCDRCTDCEFEVKGPAVRAFGSALYCERCAWIIENHEPTD